MYIDYKVMTRAKLKHISNYLALLIGKVLNLVAIPTERLRDIFYLMCSPVIVNPFGHLSLMKSLIKK